MRRNRHDETPEDAQPDNWPIVRDLFSQVIEPADWPAADCLGSLDDMAEKFSQAFPDISFTKEDLKLALHDLNIPFERNEHNNKFYYLAKWRS